MRYPTPLSQHLRTIEFWLDTLALLLLWGLVALVPARLEILSGVSLLSLLRLIAVLASLQLFGFFSFHLFNSHASFLLQGLLGGFVSSTATFLQLTKQNETADLSHFQVLKALLLATVAMLIECLLIVASVTSIYEWRLLLPIYLQLAALLSLTLILPNRSFQELAHRSMSLEDPIIWRKAMSFALLLLGLIHLMRFLSQQLDINPLLSTYAISLFEAHGVLAALVTDPQQASGSHLSQSVLALLAGHTTSKIFFALTAKDVRLRLPLALCLMFSFLIALLGHWSYA